MEYQLTNRFSTVAGVDYYNDIKFSRQHNGDLYQAYWGLNYRFNQPDTPLVVTKEIEVIKEVPVEVIKEVEVKKSAPIILSQSTGEKLFANNSSVLNSTTSLKKLLDVLKEASSSHATIVGYTDSRGRAQYNQWLSERRAKSVADYFIQHGIDETRITYTGMGESNPRASNQKVGGQAQNRRVEISID
ncbi:OmpA family protein [Photobacterium damselae]|uniref:OmpA family protein n=1 Tax=Photobacterium damselae TaxID=38293 RepID=UPI004068994D